MNIREKHHRDPQRRLPWAHCSLCGGELYQGDVCWIINGSTLCRGCLGDYAAAAFAAHRRICGEEALL